MASCTHKSSVHGSVHISLISRDFLVDSYDMLSSHWKIVGEFNAKSGDCVFPARKWYLEVIHDVVMYHIAIG